MGTGSSQLLTSGLDWVAAATDASESIAAQWQLDYLEFGTTDFSWYPSNF